jgi:hypothetical protein
MAGARFDHWRNFDVQSIRVALAPPGPTVVTPFAIGPRVLLTRGYRSCTS